MSDLQLSRLAERDALRAMRFAGLNLSTLRTIKGR